MIPAIAVVAVLILVLSGRLWLRLFGVVIIPEDSVGVVNKKFVIFGANRTLPDGCIIALKGEAGYQADTLAPGLHFWLWPWQYEVQRVKFLEVPESQLAVIEAIDGKPMEKGRVLAKAVECDAFQNARAFLTNGGERGPQIAIITPGKWRINTAIFKYRLVPAKDIEDNMVGIVTTKEGRPLDTQAGDIAGKEVPGHSMFQNGQAFVDAGGYKGLQEQVILAGRWFINPMFAEVESKEMTTVPIANVGVVIAYVGDPGVDVSGDEFQHGNIVSKGQKGVWVETYDPGKYPVNSYTHKVEPVSTANIVLNWADTKTEAHKLDANLCTIKVRSSDGFTFNLDVSQIIHIPSKEAPRVIARFGSVQNLVTQVLEPTIGNYFRNAAQKSDVIDFLTNREARQAEARAKIADALKDYNVVAVDTLIGDITPPNTLMETLTEKKLADQWKNTYDAQKLAQDARQALQQSQAMADTQPAVVAAERQVSIQQFNASAAIEKSKGEAGAKTTVAQADAMVLRTVGAAQGAKITAVGSAEADVIKRKIASMESGNYAMIE
ncbi:MAG: SPFH domain-containing protein, partial [Candidatus Komeilibacteria bacterium]